MARVAAVLLAGAVSAAALRSGFENTTIDGEEGFTRIYGNGVTILPSGNIVLQGNLSAVHLETLIDDSLKQNVTFSDKKKMLFNVLGLKVRHKGRLDTSNRNDEHSVGSRKPHHYARTHTQVADFAYTPEFESTFVEGHTFSGEPPHWYKAAYYRGVLAESLAYKLPQALAHRNVLPLTDVPDPSRPVPPEVSGECCTLIRSNDTDYPMMLEKFWYAKIDVIVTELVGAVQAIWSMAYSPASLAKLAAPGPYGGGGPVSLGMFIGAVLEVISNKGFQDVYKKSAVNGGAFKSEDVGVEHMGGLDGGATFHLLPLETQHAVQNAAGSMLGAVDGINAQTATTNEEMDARLSAFAEALANDVDFITKRASAIASSASTASSRLDALAAVGTRQQLKLTELTDLSDRLTAAQASALTTLESHLARLG